MMQDGGPEGSLSHPSARQLRGVLQLSAAKPPLRGVKKAAGVAVTRELRWPLRLCRGEPRCTFVIENMGLSQALDIFPQVLEFHGEAVLQLVETGLYHKGYRVRRGEGPTHGD